MNKQELSKHPFSLNTEYTDSPSMLPFKDITAVWWRESEIHRHTPVFSIDSLLRKTDEYPLTLAGIGGHAIVFRLNKPDMTVKISYPTIAYPKEYLKDYIQKAIQTNPSSVVDLIQEGADLEVKIPDDLLLRQVAGHRAGHTVYPQHIDPPLCIWVKKDKRRGIYVPVGYSTPFVNGYAIKIEDDPRVRTLAYTIEENCRLYLGNKNNSENAVIEPNGNIKFIDVEIRPKK